MGFSVCCDLATRERRRGLDRDEGPESLVQTSHRGPSALVGDRRSLRTFSLVDRPSCSHYLHTSDTKFSTPRSLVTSHKLGRSWLPINPTRVTGRTGMRDTDTHLQSDSLYGVVPWRHKGGFYTWMSKWPMTLLTEGLSDKVKCDGGRHIATLAKGQRNCEM